MTWSPECTQRWCSVAAACGAAAVAGNIVALNSMQDHIQQTFNLTQSEVILGTEVLNFGFDVTLPSSVVLERCGPRWASGISLVSGGIAYLLLWSTTRHIAFYINHVWLLQTYLFFAGMSSGIVYMVALSTNIYNFSDRRRGFIIGVITCSLSAGGAILTVIYRRHYEELADVASMLILLTVMFVGVHLPLMVFVRVMGDDDDDDEEDEQIFAFGQELRIIYHGELCGTKLIKKLDFQLLMCAFLFCGASQFMYVSNIDTFMESLQLKHLSHSLAFVGPIIAAVGKLLSGYLSDLSLGKHPRVSYLVFILGGQTALLTICLFGANKHEILVGTTIAIYIAMGATFVLFPAIISDQFGSSHFPTTWSGLSLGYASLAWMLSALLMKLYNANITIHSGDICSGRKCFVYSFLVTSLLSAIGTIMCYKLQRQHYTVAKA